MNTLLALVAASAYVSQASNDGDGSEDDDESVEETMEAAPKAEKKSKKSKKEKKVKKKVKASAKSDKPAKSAKADKNVVRLKDLAKQAKIGEAAARKKLRDANVERGEGRWSWEVGSKALKSARKTLGLSVG